MPIYLARPEADRGERGLVINRETRSVSPSTPFPSLLEILGVTKDDWPWDVARYTTEALKKGVFRLEALTEPKAYRLPWRNAPRTGAFFMGLGPYIIRPDYVWGQWSRYPETATIIVPGAAPLNPNLDDTPYTVQIPREDKDGSHIVGVVASGTGLGFSRTERRELDRHDAVLVASVFHDQRPPDVMHDLAASRELNLEKPLALTHN
jgi:hypothetical protein